MSTRSAQATDRESESITMAAEARSFLHDAGEPTQHGSSAAFDSPPASASGAASGPVRLTPLRELQLLEAYRSGGPESHRALTELLTAYQRRIYSVCFRLVQRPQDAADLTQDVLLKVVEHLSSYDGRSKLSTWIIRVAMNASLSHLRREKTRQVRSLNAPSTKAGGNAAAGPSPTGSESNPNTSLAAALASGEPSPLQSVEQRQRQEMVLQALDSLDPETKAILVLRDMQDLDYQQLAEALDVPLGTVKSRLFRARAAFREAFEAIGGN